MEIRSLSYSTLLYQLSFSSNVVDKGAYLVISTPDLPFYYWGNFLMFPTSPKVGDYEKWSALFHQEFNHSGCTHIAFAWDSVSGESGEIGPFEDDGYYFEYDEILTVSSGIQPTFYNRTIEVRPMDTSADWEKRIRLNVDCGDTRNPDQFEQLGNHYRNDVEQGNGLFLGAFLDDQLVGEMAIFRGGEHIGLISMVKTHPDFRKRGVCRTLLSQAIQIGKELFSFEEFVLVADVQGVSASVYKAVGFEVAEHGASLIKKL